MTLTIVPNPTAFNTMAISEKEKSQVKYTPDSQPHLVIKKLSDIEITALKKNLIITPANFINHLPNPLKVELYNIHQYCNYSENIATILNGQGSFYNRLIILLIKLDKFFTEHHFTKEQKKEAEKEIDRFLTDGKVNLCVELGRDLNHLDKEYTERKWIPESDDKILFEIDHENYRSQSESGDFFPKWMTKIKIAGIRVSEITLAYWNFRHSPENVEKDKLSDDLIRSSDYALHYSLKTLRKIKTDTENLCTDSDSERPTLSWLHIKAIDQRLSYTDKTANSTTGFKAYHWDGRNSATHKPAKRIKYQKKAKAQASIASTRFNLKTASSLSIKEEHSTESLQLSSKRTDRKRKVNPRYQDSGDTVRPKKNRKTDLSKIHLNTISPEKKKPDTLEETEIPSMVNDLKIILKDWENILKNPILSNAEENPTRAEVISALDELTRLHSACKHEIKRPESRYTEYTKTITEEAKEGLPEQVLSEDEDENENEDENPDNYKDVIADKIPKLLNHQHQNTTNVEDRNTIKKIDPDKLKSARSNFHTLINKSRELLFTPPICNLPVETPSDELDCQSLEIIINFPLYNLSNVLQFPHTEIETEDLESEVTELFKKINDDIITFRFKSGDWEIKKAQSTLNKYWEKIISLQYQLNDKKEQIFKNQEQTIQFSDNPEKICKTQAELKLIKTEQIKIATALKLLIRFSLRLRTKEHRALYKQLENIVK